MRIFGIIFLCFHSFLLSFSATAQIFNSDRKEISLLLQKGEQLYLRNKPDSSQFFFNSALKKSRVKNLPDLETKAMLCMAKVYLNKDDLKNANTLLEKSNELISIKGYQKDDITLNYNQLKGQYFLSANEYAKALVWLNSARDISKTLYPDSVLIKLEVNTGEAIMYMGKNQESLKYFDKVINSGKEYMQDYSFLIMYSLYYKTLTKFNTDKQVSFRSLKLKLDEIFHENKDTNAYNLGRLNELKASFYILYNKNAEAIEILQKARYFYNKNKNEWKRNINRITFNLAYCYFEDGDFIKSKVYFHELLNINQIKPFLSNESFFSIQIYLGLCYKNLKEYQEAFNIFNRCVNDKSLPIDYTEDVYDNIATCYKFLGEYELSEEYYNKALINRIKNKPENISDLAKTEHNFGDLYIITGRFDLAEKHLQNSNRLLKRLNERGKSLALLYTTFGKMYSKKGLLEKGISYFQISMNEFCGSFFDPKNESTWRKAKISSALDLLINVKEMANCYEKKANSETSSINKAENLINAVNCYKSAAWLTDTIRGGFQLDKSRLYLADEEKELYTNAIRTIYKLYALTGDKKWVEIAFEFSERSKSTLMLTAQQENNFTKNASVPLSLIEKLNEQKRKIAQTEYLIGEEEKKHKRSAVERCKLSEQLIELYDEEQGLKSEIKLQYPEYHTFSYKPRIVKSAEVKKRLLDNNTLIEYTLCDNEMYIIILTSDNSEMIKKDLPANFIQDIYVFYKNCSVLNPEAIQYEYYKDFVSVSNRLYSTLISPIKNKIKTNRIIIIPEVELHYVPFEALLDEPFVGGSVNYSTLPYLIREYAVSYSNSATLLCENSERIPSQNLLVVAPSYENFNESFFNGIKFKAIKGAKEEALDVLRIIGDGNSLFDNAATETNFKNCAKNYNILHLSMHCLYDSITSKEPVLIFNGRDSLNDGFLYGWEIGFLKLNASLAVLSACNTGIGQLNKGEGFINIARSFINAGCPSVIMTLWQINDIGSIHLIDKFYQYLYENNSKDRALQKAKLDYLSEKDPIKSHPYYWAGYLLNGNITNVELERQNNYWKLFYFSPIVIVMLIVMVRKRRNRKTQVQS